MKKQKSKETVISVNTADGNLNGIPPIQFIVAIQGLEALNRGMMLTRFATPQRLMEIVSQVTGQTYKRTDRNKALRDAYVVEHMIKEARKQKAEDAILARSS
jgi:uncharacterized protein YwlG (UPF0340 family)